MGDTTQLKEAFEATALFLRPEIQKNPGRSLVESLSKSLPEDYGSGRTPRERVIRRSLDLLADIHQAFIQPGQSQGSLDDRTTGIEDAKRRRVLHALLDLLSLEGIYPSLSPGAGIPLEKRVISSLPTGVVAKQDGSGTGPSSHGEAVLLHILLSLREILHDSSPSIQAIILGRLLSDLVSGTAELAFHSQFTPQADIASCRAMFLKIINDTPTPTLLPLLTSLLQPTSAPWLKAPISSQLSKVPLRQDGVFQIITFLALQFAPAASEDTRPPMSAQAIMQISRVLSSIPQGFPEKDYLMNIAPKLLSLLDGDDMDLRKTASYTIGNGLLTKRSIGAPGAIGYTIFIKPIFDTFHGNLAASSTWWLRKFSRDGQPITKEASCNLNNPLLADKCQLSLSLTRLHSLIVLHPNPALLKRLIGPLLLPLWGLYWYAKSRNDNQWAEQTFTLLQNFFSISSEKARFEKLICDILWDGEESWSYKHDLDGGILIGKRDSAQLERADIIKLVENIDERVDLLLHLMGVDPQRETFVGEIFLFVSRNWLAGEHERSGNTKLMMSPDAIQPSLQKVIYAKITEKIINQFKDVICRQPEHILELVDQLVDSEMQLEGKNTIRTNTNEPTLQSIGNIVERPNEGSRFAGTPLNTSESSESLVAALSLLSTVLTSPDFHLKEEISPLLENIKSKLDHLLPSAPSTLKQPATTASMLLEFTLSGSLTPDTRPIPKALHVSDIETHRHALDNLNSPLPPVQAEGLSLLSQLIMNSSPVLDIPATLTLLLSVILEDSSSSNDEFVYLNVIKLIGTLASKHPRTVISTLAERYRDSNEEISLDDRLRVGEALLRTVQELGDALVGDTAKVLGDTMVSVAGRRGIKPKARDKRKADTERQGLGGDESSDIEDLGVEVADLMNQMDEQTDSESEDPVKTAYSNRILQAWAAGAVSDETPDDLRVRTSAISILASAIQTNLSGLGQRIASASVDMALSTLTLELGPENAIIRRAAVVLLIDLVKSLDNAIELGNNPGFTFSHTSSHGRPIETSNTTIGNIPDILRVLTFVESKETDTIVRGHIRVLIESLEAWTEKSILRGIGADAQPRFELGDRLAGLDIKPLSGLASDSSRRGHPRIEEIE